MSRHTIGNKRGSVRGAPPDVYMGFASFHGSEEEENDAIKPAIEFFSLIVKGAVIYLVCVFCYVILYAFRQP